MIQQCRVATSIRIPIRDAYLEAGGVRIRVQVLRFVALSLVRGAFQGISCLG